jgi:FMN reductase
MEQTESPAHDLLVVGINGSLSPRSHTRMVVDIALQGAAEIGVQTSLIDLKDYDLPFCGDKDEKGGYPESVERLRTEVGAAHGIILGTPEYHGSFTGVLKNALDLMGFSEFEGKMIGLVGVSGGAMGAMNALNSLRNVGRSLHAWVVPEQASIPGASHAFDDQGKLKDASLGNRVKEVGRQVARFSFLHTADKAQDFLKEWEHAQKNPGGEH